MRFIATLLIFIAVDLIVTFILRIFGVPYFAIDIAVALIMAFIFSLWRHDRRLGPFYKNMMFHRNLAMTFIILLTISYIFGHVL